jgi:hypothetical protein
MISINTRYHQPKTVAEEGKQARVRERPSEEQGASRQPTISEDRLSERQITIIM